MKRNIIITGGGLVNKGAQAMTFIAVSELKNRFPDHEILLLSATDLERSKKELGIYNFKCIGWYPQKFARCQRNALLRIVCLLRNRQELREAEAIYKNTDLMVDISGYALGSNWSSKICNDYLDNFQFADAFNIPVYLMPQSFGPFDYKEQSDVDARTKTIFPKIKAICAREEEGYVALKENYNLTNVYLKNDLVLNNKDIDYSLVYKEIPNCVLPEIKAHNVGIIPNVQNYTVCEKKQVLNLYLEAVSCALKQGRHIYLLYHSSLDRDLCREIKECYIDEENVVFLDRDFDCVEFNDLVKSFDFLVASRFHSIVHAYKNCIPCVIVGWAEKYNVLSSKFEQAGYLLDVRENTSVTTLRDMIENMGALYKEERNTISSNLEKEQKENVFDIIKL